MTSPKPERRRPKSLRAPPNVRRPLSNNASLLILLVSILTVLIATYFVEPDAPAKRMFEKRSPTPYALGLEDDLNQEQGKPPAGWWGTNRAITAQISQRSPLPHPANTPGDGGIEGVTVGGTTATTAGSAVAVAASSGGGIPCFNLGSSSPFCVNSEAAVGGVLMRFEFPPQASWVGIGLGSSMSSADVTLAWINADGTATVSHRTASGQFEPTPNTVQDLQLNTSASGIQTLSGVSTAVVTFLRPIGGITNSQQSFIWAALIGSAPGNNPAASISYHGGTKGTFTGNLLDPANSLSAGGSRTVVGSSGPDPLVYIPLHGWLMAIAWVVMAPAGILVARYFKHRLGVWWFRLHVAFMFGGAGVLTAVSTAAIAYYTQQSGMGHLDVKESGIHVIIGPIVIILTGIQILLGFLIDYLWNPKRKGTPWWDRAHWYLGRLTLLAGLVNVPIGARLMAESQYVSNAVYIAYGILVALILGVVGFCELRGGQSHHVDE
ncbi:hypothetical protein BDK51DRAFT_28572 [Blyttiomyces helicus]|uniref:Cytochrome b561 domain-containing protein n=1 Tax=Blyttiomyces helicus TaxID=388810 RepID=A0A4P9WPN6_9FUNG|nr:hypothetical protein BDK51DRAFT_28572 [Blyttiomyces helicus]|eukprot:RKO92776.1 hypothetical protein BDK51DRAFT_28572 [Blyttiomyces helicus]